jgi:hypothetical protein
LGGAFAARRLADAEAALAQLRSREAAALARLDAVEKELADAMASGAVVARPAIEATAEQLGRPPVDAAWPILALRSLSGALLAAEVWRFSGSTLARLAVEPDALELALRSAPGAVWLALLSAAGAALAAFTFAWLALAHSAQAVKDAPTVQRGRLLLAWSTGAALLVPSVALAATAPDPVAGVVLAVALPFAGAALWRGSDALALRRSATAGAALVWDRERAREELERGRHLEAHARAAAELREAEVLRAGAETRVSALHREASAEQSIAEHSARTSAARLERLCEGLAAALEQDRYLYLRTAGERALIPSERPARTRMVDPSVGPGRLGITG